MFLQRMVFLWFVCLLPTSVSAGMITLVSDAFLGNPPLIDPGSTSGPITIGVTNDSDNDAPEDFLSGWQVTLLILPNAGARGTVGFDDSLMLPTPYILDGRNTFGFGLSEIFETNTPDDTLRSGDTIFENPFTGGVEVPVMPDTANLLQLTLSASADARGRFGIFALAQGTEWTDSNQPVTNPRNFANESESGDPVQIGEVVVTPEPSSLVMLLAGLCGLRVYMRKPQIN